MTFCVQKNKLDDDHEVFDFAGIKKQVEAQQQEVRVQAKLTFGPQLICSDRESKKQILEAAKAQKSELSIKNPQFVQTEPNSILDGSTRIAFEPNQREPQSIIDAGVFSIDGSIVMEEAEFLSDCPSFFNKSRRVGTFRNRIHLRGGRYTISANPTFELRQKLHTFAEDFEDGLDCLDGNMDYLFRLGIADYIKNAVVTMFNSLVYEEKMGRYHFDKPSYQALRRDGQRLAQAAVELFYGSMGRMPTLVANARQYLEEHRATFHKIQQYILDQYKEGVFSSRHLTRPEASHPLVIAAAAMRTARFVKAPDMIVGLPAGSTELALLQATAIMLFQRRNVRVLLVPVSLHSIKHDFDQPLSDHSGVIRFFRNQGRRLRGKHVLIVDDNSSTGKTVQLVSDALSVAGAKPMNAPSIAEADIVRSSLDLESSQRDHIANRTCYQCSVNVLPVSKKIALKGDLRQILESRKMVRCIKDRYLKPTFSLRRTIVGKVYIDLIANPSETVLPTLGSAEQISSFRKTFLSNFYEVPISYLGVSYLSVEHAYQAMKFTSDALSNVTESHLDTINKRLSERGVAVNLDDLPKLFTDKSFTAGTSKVAANQLRILGYVRDDWDYVKADIMCQLLIQKFSDPTIYGLLKETGSKYLVEGNDWGDTYWGVSGGRGRNALGRMLMQIRSIQREALLAASKTDLERVEFDLQ